ncbi:Txe/YoeB family addiction module toxin [Kamptonema cortianum]|nr:Txe/YoeB family addiction module toxin [Kamptonema cortianum]
MTGKVYSLEFTKHAQKDALRLKKSGLKEKTQQLLELLQENPWKNPPPYEKLVGDLKGIYSRRINIQHRLVYEIHEKEKRVRVLRMWSHYEN